MRPAELDSVSCTLCEASVLGDCRTLCLGEDSAFCAAESVSPGPRAVLLVIAAITAVLFVVPAVTNNPASDQLFNHQTSHITANLQ